MNVRLPAELVDRLRVDARRRGIGVSTLVRMLVLAGYERTPPPKVPA